MKLVFPGGEHPQVLLGPGVNRIGSDPRANIVLDRPGVLPQHCQLHVTPSGVMLDVPHGTSVTVNGRRVDGLIALRPGDSVAFDGVEARLSSMESAAAVRHQAGVAGRLPESANDDPGATAVRPVLPRYVLRGVSGEAFGRTYPIHGSTTVGRADECSLRIDEPGMSRMHARLLPVDDGVLIEDLGSTNGCFLNGKRVLRGEARVGDEIGFDTMRFRVIAPGQSDTHHEDAHVGEAKPNRTWMLVAGIAIAAGAVLLVAFL
ncbi:FHA domain-containing protein [Lysobacter sp. A6]|uniref:FHA domain-containing protein n=1 Tax=Noviluteimonas lactosilytica TaxID=2888523 RepID=A0ABS8JJU8_9GAMM|nr:FHA domain-containing protein [Lysobacter lactosilyticus]MCC8363878.1 FHA domain-containing protein [Lysobacter lactosilyticus]